MADGLDFSGLKPAPAEAPQLDFSGLKPAPEETSDLDFSGLKPAAPEKAPGEGGFLSTLVGAGARGAIEATKDVGQAPTAFRDREAPKEDTSYIGRKLAEPISAGWKDPDWWAAQLGHGIAHSYPSLALGAAGSIAGAATPLPGGALIGGAAGFGLGSVIQEIAPAYQRARAEGLDHDKAVDRAMLESGISGAFGAAMGLAPGLTAFGKTAEGAIKKPISEALLQIFGVQPAIGAAQEATTNVAEGKPVEPASLAQQYALNVGQGVGLVGAHAGVHALAPTPKAPPTPESAPVEVLDNIAEGKPPNAPRPAEPGAPPGLTPVRDHTGQVQGYKTATGEYRDADEVHAAMAKAAAPGAEAAPAPGEPAPAAPPARPPGPIAEATEPAPAAMPVVDPAQLRLLSEKARLEQADREHQEFLQNLEVGKDAPAAQETLARVQAVDTQLQNPDLSPADRRVLARRRDELLQDTNPETLQEQAAPLEMARQSQLQRQRIQDRLTEIDQQLGQAEVPAALSELPKPTPQSQEEQPPIAPSEPITNGIQGQPISRDAIAAAIADPESPVSKLYTTLRDRLNQLGLDQVGLKLENKIEALAAGQASEADGRYLNRLIQVALDNRLGEPGMNLTMHHEAVHAMRDLGLFTDAEWRILSKAPEVRARLDELQDRYDRAGIEIAKDGLVEEAIADQLAAWSTAPPAPKSLLGRMYGRIVNFLHSIGEALRGNGFNSVDSIAQAFRSGEIGRRAENVAENAREPKLWLRREEAEQVAERDEAITGIPHQVFRRQAGNGMVYYTVSSRGTRPRAGHDYRADPEWAGTPEEQRAVRRANYDVTPTLEREDAVNLKRWENLPQATKDQIEGHYDRIAKAANAKFEREWRATHGPRPMRGDMPEGRAGRSSPMAAEPKHSLRGKDATENQLIEHLRKTVEGRMTSDLQALKAPTAKAKLYKTLRDLAKEGEAGRFWYERSGKAILDYTRGDTNAADKIAQLIAIYSPRNSVASNTNMAIKAWNRFLSGRPVDNPEDRIGTSSRDKAAAELLEKGVPFEGRKVNNFYQNLTRVWTHGQQGVTADVWMARAFGFVNSEARDANKYELIERATKKIANELGWEPQQVQAAVWVATKTRYEQAKGDTIDQAVKKGWVTLTKVGPGKPEMTIKDPDKLASLWRKNALGSDVDAGKLEASIRDFSDFIGDNLAQVSVEAIPGKTTEHLSGLHDQPPQVRAEYFQRASQAMLDAEGRDEIAHASGVISADSFDAPGYWQGASDQSQQRRVAVTRSKRIDEKATNADERRAIKQRERTIEPGQKEVLRSLAATYGFVQAQEGVGFHLSKPSHTLIDANAVQIDAGRSLTADEMVALGKALAEAHPAANDGTALVATPTGVRVLSFDEKALPNPELHQAVDAAVERAIDGDVKIVYHGHDADLALNDWKESPYGQDYLKAIGGARRSDLLRAAGNVLARLEPVDRDFAQRYGLGFREDLYPGLRRELAAALGGDDAGKLSLRRDDFPEEADRPLAAPVSLDRLTGGPEAQRDILSRFGHLTPGEDTTANLKIYNLQRMVDDPTRVNSLLDRYGFRAKYFAYFPDEKAGVEVRLPRIKMDGYDKGTLWIYDPREANGSFKDATYTNAWRLTHELGHALVEPLLADKYGPSHREGQLGQESSTYRGKWPNGKRVPVRALTLDEAQRAIEWEDLAFRAQRRLFEQAGEKISDADFAHEYNINLSDAIYRTLTGEFGNPGEYGFMPSDRPAPLRDALALLQRSEEDLAQAQGREPTRGVDLATWQPASDADIARMLQHGMENPRPGNSSESDQLGGKFSLRRDEQRDPFFSMLTRAVEDIQQPKAPAAQWANMIRNLTQKGVKQDEIDWSGVQDWLGEQKGVLTKDQVLEHLRSNEIQLEEVMRGEAGPAHIVDENGAEFISSHAIAAMANREGITPDEAIQRILHSNTEERGLRVEGDSVGTKFAGYTMPGGENYRELLLTMPPKPFGYKIEKGDRFNPFVVTASDGRIVGRAETEAQAHDVARSDSEYMAKTEGRSYKSPHWDEPNVLAHIRLNDRTDADGKKVLFVEEIQSDWHQAGRKKGYKSEATQAQIDKLRDERRRVDMDDAAYDRLTNEIEALKKTIPPAGVPDAPLKTQWPELAMKRVLRYAAEHGYDKVAWTPGEVQAHRYDLARHIGEIRAWRDAAGKYDIAGDRKGYPRFDQHMVKYDMTEKDLEATVGKDVAKRIVDALDANDNVGPDRVKKSFVTLNNLDLKVGGEGMKGFYDKMLPSIANKLAKKWGAKVGDTEIHTNLALSKMSADAYTKVHALDVTPEMREGVMQGQPMWSLRRDRADDIAGLDHIERETGDRISVADLDKARGPMWSLKAHGQQGTPDQEKVIKRVLQFHEDVPVGQRIRETVQEVRANGLAKFRQGFLDRLDAVAQLEKSQNAGKLLAAETSAYKAMRMTSNLSSVMHVLLKKGMITYRNGEVVPVAGFNGGFEGIFKPLAESGKLRLFQAWAVANRANRLLREGREKLMEQDDIDALLPLGNQHPEFAPTLAKYQAFNQKILDFAHDSGLIDAELRDKLRSNDYVPFYRILDKDGNVGGPGVKGGVSGQSAGIRVLRGGEGMINDLFQNMTRNMSRMVDASFKNIAATRTIDLALKSGAVTKRGPDFKPVHFTATELQDALDDIGIGSDVIPASQKDLAIKLFSMVQPKDENVVSIKRGGKTEYYTVDDPLLLSAFGPAHIKQNGLVMFGGRFSNLLRRGVTTLPDFMTANFIRDTMSAWVISGGKTNPLRAVDGFISSLRNSAEAQEIAAAGGGGKGYYGTLPEDVSRQLSDKAGGDAHGILHKAWEIWEKVGQASEQANRIAVYKALKKQGASNAEAAYQALDLLDFSMRGDFASMRAITTLVPFLNARIQGLYKLGRAAKENPAGFWMRGAAIMLPSLALTLNSIGQPWYNGLNPQDRELYYHFMIGGQHFRLPKPFEIGALFSTAPEILANNWYGTEYGQHTAQRIGAVLADQFNFDPTPQAIKPLLNQAMNQQGWGGDPIVSHHFEDLPPAQQYTPRTSTAARVIGNWTDTSPLRLDALMSGYFGSFGSLLGAITTGVDHAFSDTPVPTKRIEEYPLVGRYIRGEPALSTQWSQSWYQIASDARAVTKGAKQYQEAGEPAKAAKLLKDNPGAQWIAAQSVAIGKQLAGMARQEQRILASKEMSPDEKRRRLDELMARRNQIQKDAVTRSRAVMNQKAEPPP